VSALCEERKRIADFEEYYVRNIREIHECCYFGYRR